MSTEAKISVEELRENVGPDMERLLAEVAGALNDARAGAIIADSEEIVREAMAKFRQTVYERAVQLAADKAAKAAFSPSAQREDGPEGSQQRPSRR
jgi:hypothetical protein